MAISHYNGRWPIAPMGQEGEEDIDTQLIPFVVGKNSGLDTTEIVAIAFALFELTSSSYQEKNQLNSWRASSNEHKNILIQKSS